MAERAGVSRGAHLHHFQTRTALVAAAVEQLASGAGRASCVAAATRSRTGPSAHARRLDLLWAHYASPLFQGALDLWSDARTDVELRERLIEVERAARPPDARARAPAVPAGRRARATSRASSQQAVATVRGLAMLDTLHPDGERNRQQWPFCRARLAALFATAGRSS